METGSNSPSHILPEGTILPHNYIIKGVLGEGGFGITYVGFHTLTNEKAAIKEYFPSGLAAREFHNGQYQLVPFQGSSKKAFERGCRHFLNEASILREFHHLNNIVSVKDVIETNGTVYLVMEYIDGITLKQYVKENGALTFDELLSLMKPIIQSLIQIHKSGLIHRDISPDNLMIGIDNQLHLIDFGAASFENVHETRTMTVMLKSGYAPPEQYLSDGKQGAWTDIYALCSTMYLALTGFAPPESIKRLQSDDLPPLVANAAISSWQAAAIEKGMSVRAADRFQNMETLYQALIIPPIEADSKRRAYQNASIEENKTVMKYPAKSLRNRRLLFRIIWAGVLCAVLYCGLGIGGMVPFPLPSNTKMTDSPTENPKAEDTLPNPEAVPADSLCTMVEVVGSTLSDARKQLYTLDSSIRIQTEWVYDSKYAANTVTAQSIAEGISFTKGSLGSILLTVSRGKEPDQTDSTADSTGSTTDSAAGKNNSSTENSKKGSPDNQTATSNKQNNQDNFDISPIEDDYDNFTID